jgi:type II secretory pathway pseudopilin PulG
VGSCFALGLVWPIILILISIALPNFLEAQIRAKVARVSADMRTIAIALESYLIDWRTYPPKHDPTVTEIGEKGLFQLTTPLTYLKELPNDAFIQSGAGLDRDEEGFEFNSTGQPISQAHRLPPIGNVTAFLLHSHGPNGDDDCDGNNSWPFCDRNNPCDPTHHSGGQGGCMTYSPTNGSKSGGELIEMGGQWRSGSWYLDGWQHIKGKWLF